MPLYAPQLLDRAELAQLGARAIAGIWSGYRLSECWLLGTDDILLGAWMTDVLGPDAAFALFASETQRRVLAGDYTDQTANKLVGLVARLVKYLERGCRVDDISAATADQVRGWVNASLRVKGAGLVAPGAHLIENRIWASNRFFYELRRLGHFQGHPLLDVDRPGRPGASFRPLTDAEVQRCHGHSAGYLLDTRGPAAWALGEASATTSEIPAVTVADCSSRPGQVWLSGGARHVGRWGQLTAWGEERVERRKVTLAHQPDALLVYQGDGSDESRQASACDAVHETLKRAGLGGRPGVRPMSLRAWRGLKVYDETSDVLAVALALGCRSLDDAARLIGLAITRDELPEHRRTR